MRRSSVDTLGAVCQSRAAHIYSTGTAPGNAGAHVKAVGIDGTNARVTAAADEIESEIKLRKVAGAPLIRRTS